MRWFKSLFTSSSFQQPDGINFRLDTRIPVGPLCDALSKVVAFLQDESSAPRLNRFDDWWQHDGLHFHEGTISSDELARIVSQPQRLREAMPGDFAVRVGIQRLDPAT